MSAVWSLQLCCWVAVTRVGERFTMPVGKPILQTWIGMYKNPVPKGTEGSNHQRDMSQHSVNHRGPAWTSQEHPPYLQILQDSGRQFPRVLKGQLFESKGMEFGSMKQKSSWGIVLIILFITDDHRHSNSTATSNKGQFEQTDAQGNPSSTIPSSPIIQEPVVYWKRAGCN